MNLYVDPKKPLGMAKLLNKRIIVEKLDNGNYRVQYKRLLSKKEQESVQRDNRKEYSVPQLSIIRGKIKITHFELSGEAVYAQYELLRILENSRP